MIYCRSSMNKRCFAVPLLPIILVLLQGCGGDDSDYYPRAMKGLEVWVVDRPTDKQFFGGYIEANYFSREDAAASCAQAAYLVAETNHLKDWGYVCCTVTSSSRCETKVR